MKKVGLYSLSGAALIIPMKTGVIFTNQVNGYACDQPELEGLLIPFNDDHLLEDYQLTLEYQLMSLFEDNGWGKLIEAQANKINELLHQFPETNCALVDMSKLNESYEAWVWCHLNLNFIQNHKYKHRRFLKLIVFR